MDKKPNTLSQSREHIFELSEIIKTAILREITRPHVKQKSTDTLQDDDQNTGLYDEIHHTSVGFQKSYEYQTSIPQRVRG